MCVIPAVFVSTEFDEKVLLSRLEAEEALKKIPEIERLINDAEQMTREAHDSLAQAERDADVARELAEQARRVAENADRVRRDVLFCIRCSFRALSVSNCLQWFKVSLRTLTTANCCLTHLLFHDCTNVLYRQYRECCVRHASLVTCD